MIDFPDDLGCESSIDDSEDSPALPKCSDHRDNDGDGKVDFPDDPGCLAPLADDETDDCPDGPMCPQCGNGKDDDLNGEIDYPHDIGCSAASDPIEFTATKNADRAAVSFISNSVTRDNTSALSPSEPMA